MANRKAGFQDHTVLGTFSTDEEEKYLDTLGKRRYLVEPDDDRPNFDLMQGFEDYVMRERKGVKPTSLSPVLEWMRDHRDELKENDVLKSSGGGAAKKLNVDFVARRGFLARLLRAAQSVDQVEFLVTLCEGTYYIEYLKDTDYDHAVHEEIGFSGKKFFQYVTSADGEPPDTTQPIDAHESYYAVMKAQCGNHSIMFSSEIQAERKDSPERPPANYVALKTNKLLQVDSKAMSNFNKYKTLTWWSQTHVAGIPEVLCGWRDDARHVLTSVEMMKTAHLPSKSGGFWSSEACLAKFESVLSDIKAKVKDDNPSSVYRLELQEVERRRDTKQKLQSRRLTYHGRRTDDYVILPDWYVKDVLGMQQ